jgi:hypothetical protein
MERFDKETGPIEGTASFARKRRLVTTVPIALLMVRGFDNGCASLLPLPTVKKSIETRFSMAFHTTILCTTTMTAMGSHRHQKELRNNRF